MSINAKTISGILIGGVFLFASTASNAWWYRDGWRGGYGYHGGYYHRWGGPVIVGAPAVARYYGPACRTVRMCSPARCWWRRVCN